MISALDDLEQWLSRQLSINVSVNTELARALLRLARAVQAEYAATTIEALEEAREEKNKAFAALEAL